MFSKYAIAVAVVLAPSLATAQEVTGDAEAGERVFNKCQACHVVEQEQNRVGPHLNGVIGREAGAVEGYSYSPALQKLADEGVVWDQEALSAYLENPREYAPGTKMIFPGLKKEEERQNVIAYLAQFSGEESQ